jgi:hypothetical protein
MVLSETLPSFLPSVNDTLRLNVEDSILEAIADGTDLVYLTH